MRLHREDVGAVDHRLVRVGIVRSYLLQKFILPQHRTNMGCGAAALQHENGCLARFVPSLGASIAPFKLLRRERLAGGRERSERADLLHQQLADDGRAARSEEHTSELQSRQYLVCRLLLEKKKQ